MNTRQFAFSLFVGVVLIGLGLAILGKASVGISLAALGLAIIVLSLLNRPGAATEDQGQLLPIAIEIKPRD
ncbi:hypothetical protein HBA55_04295 [Pseudomaricurvus alkylphenolicus]|uniref:hypothetical protein n=1 Tax=Pseudomaricurvus alkylphenolicus TaxID=1306991 RepID=UPI00141F6DB0|nr:hypothetical protein [Pseudomaricurvus alkylphenolicus]NIB38791.1 hypothetical protein [Pseudomaricurvus alkylphenolicus]